MIHRGAPLRKSTKSTSFNIHVNFLKEISLKKLYKAFMYMPHLFDLSFVVKVKKKLRNADLFNFKWWIRRYRWKELSVTYVQCKYIQTDYLLIQLALTGKWKYVLVFPAKWWMGVIMYIREGQFLGGGNPIFPTQIWNKLAKKHVLGEEEKKTVIQTFLVEMGLKFKFFQISPYKVRMKIVRIWCVIPQKNRTGSVLANLMTK